MPKREGETMDGFVIRLMRDEFLREASRAAKDSPPPGPIDEYWRGRLEAAAAIDAIISERS